MAETPISKTVSDLRSEFFGAALTMSWQLAIVIIVPILGGFELDKKLHSSPFITLLGFVIAMIGMAMVMRVQLQRFRPPAASELAKMKKIPDEDND